MYHISENTQCPKTGAIRYSIWSEDWTRVFDIDLTPEKFKKFKGKKQVNYVNWMHVLSATDEEKGTGQHARTVETIEELR